MFTQIPSPGRPMIALFLGFAIPMTLLIPLLQFVTWWDRTLPTSSAPFSVGGLLLSLGLGFFAMTHRMRAEPRIAVAIGYFPMMCVVLFLEAMHVSLKYFGSDNF